VACLHGRFEPAVFAAHLDWLGHWYNRAPIMVERNNHGHAVLLWLHDNSPLRRLGGIDGNPGWLTSTKSKTLLYDRAAEAFRECEVIVCSMTTYVQLQSIEGATLSAPDGQFDDRATSFVLSIAAGDKADVPQGFAPRVSGRHAAPVPRSRSRPRRPWVAPGPDPRIHRSAVVGHARGRQRVLRRAEPRPVSHEAARFEPPHRG
jgi:hypothetical protein